MTDLDERARGEHVRKAREDRNDRRGRTAAEVRALREDAARSARVCADCFEPLPPSASVTMVGRPVIIPPVTRYYPTEHKEWLRVPICLTCWLIELQRGAARGGAVLRLLVGHVDQHEQEQFRIAELARRRCLTCGRPLRLYQPIHMSEQVCCSARNERNRLRRHVKHQPMRCLVCGKSFMPRRTDAQTCSNACRQRLFRRQHRKPRRKAS
jgi:hypothetical protein